MERVGWELENGVRSWSSLMSMAQEAVSSLGYVPVSTFGKDWVGWYFQEKDVQGRRLGQSLFYLGAYWDKPKILVFQTEGVIVPSNFFDIAKCGKMMGPTKWSNELDLDSEEIHFFAKSESSQLQTVLKFLGSCLDLTKQYKAAA